MKQFPFPVCSPGTMPAAIYELGGRGPGVCNKGWQGKRGIPGEERRGGIFRRRGEPRRQRSQGSNPRCRGQGSRVSLTWERRGGRDF